MQRRLLGKRGLKFLDQWRGRAGQRGVRGEYGVVLDSCLSVEKMGMGTPFTELGHRRQGQLQGRR